MDSESLRQVYVTQAVKADKTSDKAMWKSALFCSKVVGKYDEGATKALAFDMSRSTDTVEDRAHGYWMFEYLCNIGASYSEDGKLLSRGTFRELVFHARRLPYVHFSHFRALWDQKKAFNLDDQKLMDLLMDIVQNEGGISSRSLEAHIRSKYGIEKSWLYHMGNISKEVSKLLNHPDTPKGVRITFQKVRKILPVTKK